MSLRAILTIPTRLDIVKKLYQSWSSIVIFGLIIVHVYAGNFETFGHLEATIHQAIADIRQIQLMSDRVELTIGAIEGVSTLESVGDISTIFYSEYNCDLDASKQITISFDTLTWFFFFVQGLETNISLIVNFGFFDF